MNGLKERTEQKKLTGLPYFGKMMAAISHEIKNSLAIINENAGLMEDLSLMAKRGTPLDPERIGTIAGRITRQIQRADTRVKKMNRLAHSVDNPGIEIDVEETLAFTLDLGEKFLAALGIKVEVSSPDVPVIINTNEFLFMNLTWEILGCVVQGVDKQAEVTITIRRNGNGVEFVFAPFDGGASTLPEDGQELTWDRAVAEILGASILPLAETRELVLKLPKFVESV